MLTRAEVLKAGHKIEVLEIPDAGSVHVRTITCGELDTFRRKLMDAKGDDVKLADARDYLVAVALCDATGARLFPDADIPLLREMRREVLEPIFQAAQRLAGMNREEGKKT